MEDKYACEFCGKPHSGSYGSRRFCTKECAKAFATKGKRAEISRQVSITLKSRVCSTEGTERKRNAGILNFKNFDLNPDASKLRKGWAKKSTDKRRAYVQERLLKWVTGEIILDRTWIPNIRKFLIRSRGNRCEKCGWCEINPYTNLVPIQMDHINGDPHENGIQNLVLLCPNCHSLTPTWGGANRGKGREGRYVMNSNVAVSALFPKQVTVMDYAGSNPISDSNLTEVAP
jgi:hypothetical protein